MTQEVVLGLKGLEWICPICGEYQEIGGLVPLTVVCKSCEGRFEVDIPGTLEVVQSQITQS